MQKMKEFYSKYKVWVLLALFVVMAILPFVIKKTLYIRYLCNIMMYATLAGSLNAINGYSGQMCSRTGRLLRYRRIYQCQLFPRISESASGFCCSSAVSWLCWSASS